MVDERTAQYYFHVVSVLVPRFLTTVKSIVAKDPNYLDDNCEECLRIRWALGNGTATTWDAGEKVSAAASAAEQMKRVANDMITGGNGSWILNDVQMDDMERTLRRISPHESELKRLLHESAEEVLEMIRQRIEAKKALKNAP